MKNLLLFFIFGFFSTISFAQIDIPRSTNTRGLLKAEPESNFPSLRLKEEKTNNESKYLKDKPKEFDYREKNDDLIDEGTVVEKKWKKEKNKEIKDEYKKDQYLGDFKTRGKFVEIYCRDHEYVDGDRVKVYINDEVILPNLLLKGNYYPIMIKLDNGFNRIDIEALNQGTSGPNTAAFKIYDEDGKLVSEDQWNLTTGTKASLVVVKQ